jgi:hypothetical protein
VLLATRPNAATGGMAVDGLKSRFKTVFSLGMEGLGPRPTAVSISRRQSITRHWLGKAWIYAHFAMPVSETRVRDAATPWCLRPRSPGRFRFPKP